MSIIKHDQKANIMINSILDEQLTVTQLAKLLGISPATTWRLLKAGSIPAPHGWGGNSKRWDSTEVQFALIGLTDNSRLLQQLTVLEVGKVLGVSPATVWRLAKAGLIPQPRKIGENSTRWDSRELDDAVSKLTINPEYQNGNRKPKYMVLA